MARCLTFCTARISPERITYLIKEMTSFEANDTRGNCISLVQDPEQRQFDDPTPFPIDESFETNFEGYAEEDLGNFVKAHLPHTQGQIECNMFAVLDERSLHEDTLLLARWLEKFSEEALETGNFAEDQKLWEGWVIRRVPFHQVASIATSLCEPEIAELAWRDLDPTAGATMNDNGVFSFASKFLVAPNKHPKDHDVPPREKRL